MEKAAAIAALLLSLPSNGAIGLVQSVKPPVTSLGYYDLISKSYVPPLLLGDIVKRIKSGPDYISLNVPIPVLYGLVGFDLLITRDYYNNWYIGGGGAATTGPGFDIGAGWFLTNTRTEDHLETALSGHSFTVSGGNILGVGINLTDPAFTHLESDFRIKAERVALEGEGTTPGGTIVYTYSLVLYDSGNPDPWLPIIPRSWK
jgi:hypothetical protein